MALVARTNAGMVRAGRVPRPVVQNIEAVRNSGLVTAAEILAAAAVTHTALGLAVMLSAEEGRAIALCPLGEARYRVLVDQFTAVAANTIARLGW